MFTIDREAYGGMYGPTTGDKIRLADTDLIVEIEKDYAIYGEECKFGGSKTIRDGMGQNSGITNKNGALDFLSDQCGDHRLYRNYQSRCWN